MDISRLIREHELLIRYKARQLPDAQALYEWFLAHFYEDLTHPIKTEEIRLELKKFWDKR